MRSAECGVRSAEYGIEIVQERDALLCGGDLYFEIDLPASIAASIPAALVQVSSYSASGLD